MNRDIGARAATLFLALVLLASCAVPTGTPGVSPTASPTLPAAPQTPVPEPTPSDAPTVPPGPTEPVVTPAGPTVAPDPSLPSDAAFRFFRLKPARSDEPLINPGKGWILYDNGRGDFSAQSAATWAYGSVGYVRFNWSDIEKSDGVYDWTMVDGGRNQCKAEGKNFVFGVMACDPTSQVDYTTPKFILDRPDVNSLVLSVPNYSLPDGSGGYKKMMKHVIDWTNPGAGYYRKLDDFAKALAERYGNDPDVEYIDIRGFGSWGENSHAWLDGSSEPGYDEGISDPLRQDTGVDPEVMKRCWSSYINAFKGRKVQLMTAWGFGCNQDLNFTQKEPYYWAVQQGVGLRRDGYSGYNDCKCLEVLWGLNKVPLALEMASSYQWQRDNRGYDAARLLESPEQNRASYYALGTYGTDGGTMLRQLQSAVDAVTNRIGYHFRLEEAVVSQSIGKGERGTISMEWTNDGVAKLFLESHVGIALLDSAGNVVESRWLEGVDPRSWVCAMDMVTKEKTNSATATFEFSDATASGRHRLAIGLFTDRGLANPDIRIGNAGRTDGGWYVLYDESAPVAAEKDFAAGRPATASSRLSSSTDAPNAVLHGSGFWSSADAATEWLAVDFGTTRTVGSLSIDWGRHYAKSYKVQTSLSRPRDPGAAWTDVFSTTAGEGGKETVSFEVVAARSIRVLCSASASASYSYSGIGPFKSQNLLLNAGFESGFNAWRDYNADRATITTDRFKTGAKSLKLTGAKLGQIQQALTSTFELSGPGRYRISFDAFGLDDVQSASFEIGVKGSRDDQTGVAWWAPKTRYTLEQHVALAGGAWTTVAWEGDVAWQGLMEMAYLRIDAYSGIKVDQCIDNVRIEAVSAISGERSTLFIPSEGRYTILGLRAR